MTSASRRPHSLKICARSSGCAPVILERRDPDRVRRRSAKCANHDGRRAARRQGETLPANVSGTGWADVDRALTTARHCPATFSHPRSEAFKFWPRENRLHQKPPLPVKACRPWSDRELGLDQT